MLDYFDGQVFETAILRGHGASCGVFGGQMVACVFKSQVSGVRCQVKN